jgi:hypothetical protein
MFRLSRQVSYGQSCCVAATTLVGASCSTGLEQMNNVVCTTQHNMSNNCSAHDWQVLVRLIMPDLHDACNCMRGYVVWQEGSVHCAAQQRLLDG